MILISGNNLKMEYGSNKLFENINFEIQENQKIGLVGNNGVGKTTLFKIINGSEEPKNGQISISHNVKIGYLEQQPRYMNMSVKDVLLLSFSSLILLGKKMQELEEKMSSCDNENDLNKYVDLYSEVIEQYEHLGGYEYETTYNMITTGLNFTENFCEMKFEDLSGGQKTKVMLAKMLLMKPNILLLDEPTNYLDIDSLKWLEDYLQHFNGTFILISHDRYFLDKCISSVFELTSNSLETYNGNYSSYVIEKQNRFDEKMKDYIDQQKIIQKMDDQIKWMQSKGSNVLKSKAHQIEHRMEKIEKIDKPYIMTRKMKISLNNNKSAKEIVSFEGLTQGYEKNLFENVSGTIYSGDSIGIVGENGVGKTTLIKTILGELAPISGSVKISDNIKIGYLDQESKFTDENKTILDTFIYETNLGNEKARGELAKLLFFRDDVNKKIKMLSGGEKKRLKLAMLIQNSPNFIVLDEPTNHLDLSSREQLENVLIDYKGTMIFISHDRYFLNKLAGKIWVVTSEGINEINGNYDDYLEQKELIKTHTSINKKI